MIRGVATPHPAAPIETRSTETHSNSDILDNDEEPVAGKEEDVARHKGGGTLVA